jgi:RES domain-containing protein
VKPTLAQLTAALKSVPTIPVKATFSRMVPFTDLVKYTPPNWLFTSGKANRYNPAGVNCVYFAESEAVAKYECDDQWKTTSAAKQPVVTYYADIELARVIDLASPAALKALGLQPADLLEPWRLASTPTSTQLLGQAVHNYQRITAMRYPSKAAADQGHAGHNFVIFQNNVLFSPDYVHILGPDKGKPLQSWP